jgi:hypothetical protein
MKKQLILHVGMTKTGSTAIQHFLENNAKLLEERGILYPEMDGQTLIVDGEPYVSAGNAHHLSLILDSFSSNESYATNKVKDWSDRIYQTAISTSCDIVFLSSENLCKLDAPALALLKECLDPFFDTEVVVFKREPYQWLFSSWLQVVKREANAQWFGDVNVNASLKPFLIERHLKEIFPAHHHILDYEIYKKDLVSGLFSALGLSERITGIPYNSKQMVNRSLSCDELYLALQINSASGGDVYLSEVMSDAILSEENNKTCFFYQHAIYKQIVKFFRQNKLTIKKHDYSNTPQVTLYSEWVALYNAKYSLSARLLVSAIHYYKERIQDFVNLAYEKVYFYRDSPYLCYTPNDFDAFTYCILNQDVLNSDIDPYKHFVEFGRKESRSYIVPQGVRAVTVNSKDI